MFIYLIIYRLVIKLVG